MKQKTNALKPELLHKMDACWRAASYLLGGQIYLYDNPLLKQPLTPMAHFTKGEAASLARSRR